MDTRLRNPLFEVPSAPAVASSGWESAALWGPGLEGLADRIQFLREAGLDGGIVVAEFLRRQVAPLQAHQGRMWSLVPGEDGMQLVPGSQSSDVVYLGVRQLLGEGSALELLAGAARLYRLPNADDIRAPLPHFDEWGLCPPGQEGRGNPFVPLPVGEVEPPATAEGSSLGAALQGSGARTAGLTGLLPSGEPCTDPRTPALGDPPGSPRFALR